MGSHYIKVGKVNLSLDQNLMDIICPASGYVPDPALPVFPSDYLQLPDPTPDDPEAGNPSDDKIVMLFKYGNVNTVDFKVYCSDGYTVDVYGADNAVIHTETLSNGASFTYTLVEEYGEPSTTGDTTYRIEITPAGSTYNIIRFLRNTAMQKCKLLAIKFYTPGLTSLEDALYQCEYIEEIKFYSDCNSLTSADEAFRRCYSLTYAEIPASTGLPDLYNTFLECSGLMKVKFLGDLPVLTDMTQCFSGCKLLNDITYPNSMPFLTTMYKTHENNYALQGVRLPETDNWCAYYSTFYNCYALKSIDMSHNKINSLYGTFYNCTAVETIILPSSNSSVIITTNAFRSASKLESLTFPADAILSNPTNTGYCFYGCSSLVSVTMPTVDQTEELNMSYFFCSCSSLKTINWGSDNWTGVNRIDRAFYYCSALETLSLPVNMPNPLSATHLCYGCSSLITLSLPANWASVTSLYYAFRNCSSLITLTLPNDLSAVTNITYWIDGCTSLESLSTALWGSTVFGSPTGGLFPISVYSFNQPTLKISGSISLETVGTANTNYIEIEWTNSFTQTSAFTLSFANLQLDAIEIDRIFTVLPSTSYGTINVIGNPGYATCDPSIATAKGWTVL